MSSSEIDIEGTEIRTDTRTFREYLKGPIRVWMITGTVIAVFLLSRGLLEGHIHVKVDNNELEGIKAVLFICFGIPLGMALNGVIWGVITYLPYRLISKITSKTIFKS